MRIPFGQPVPHALIERLVALLVAGPLDSA